MDRHCGTFQSVQWMESIFFFRGTIDGSYLHNATRYSSLPSHNPKDIRKGHGSGTKPMGVKVCMSCQEPQVQVGLKSSLKVGARATYASRTETGPRGGWVNRHLEKGIWTLGRVFQGENQSLEKGGFRGVNSSLRTKEILRREAGPHDATRGGSRTPRPKGAS